MLKKIFVVLQEKGPAFFLFTLSGAGFGLLFDQKTLSVSFFLVVFILLLPFFLLRPASGKRAFLEGAFFGFAANFIGIRWLLVTMEDYGHLPWPLAFSGLFLFSAYLSLFPAFFRYATFRSSLWGKGDAAALAPKALLLAPAFWILSESGKTEILTGFPWNPLGSLLFGHRDLASPARVIGTTGLSFFVVLGSTLLGLSVGRIKAVIVERKDLRTAVIWPLATVAFLSAWALWGNLLEKDNSKERLPALQVALIQGNIPPDQKWTPDHLKGDLKTYLGLSQKEISTGARFIVWPETALPVFYNAPLPFVSKDLKTLLSPRAFLLTGSIGEIPSPDTKEGFSFTNAAVLYGPEGQVNSDYVKQHLVPFGEYLPLPILFGWLRPLLGVAGDMAHSNKPVQFSLPGGGSVSPVICYEALYPSLVRNGLGNSANVLAVLSDDAWFGNTSAPYQLFRESAMRAIENGIPMVRAANTGLSGVVSPDGTVMTSGPLFQTVALHASILLPKKKTFYRKHGEWVLKLSLLLLLFWTASVALIDPAAREMQETREESCEEESALIA